MLRIWGRTNSSNVQKVMWAVGELGLAHERIDVGGAFGRLDSPEYTALNPNRLIPVDRGWRHRDLGIERHRALPRGPLRRGRFVGRGPGRALGGGPLDGLAAHDRAARARSPCSGG